MNGQKTADSHGDVKCSTENIVNNVAAAVHGTRWVSTRPIRGFAA